MDLERTPHRAELYISGVKVGDRWVGSDMWVTVEEIYDYCEKHVSDLEQFDVCMRMVICIEEYESWWGRLSAKKESP